MGDDFEAMEREGKHLERAATSPSKEDRLAAKQRRRRRNRLVVLLVVAVLIALLGADNRHEVPVEYLVGETEVRLVWVILVSFAAGAVFERAYTFVRGRRRDED